jgi:hypothetical protein
LSSPGGGENIVMPTHSVAVLANGLLAVRMAKAVGGSTVHWPEVTLAESFAGCHAESSSRTEINPRQASYGCPYYHLI